MIIQEHIIHVGIDTILLPKGAWLLGVRNKMPGIQPVLICSVDPKNDLVHRKIQALLNGEAYDDRMMYLGFVKMNGSIYYVFGS